jgi:TonB-linked SusC/RagA family outer membrane protein
MKLTTVLLITTMLHVSAATLAQKVTLSQKNMQLKQVFKEIRKQTGYNVLWQPSKVDASIRIDVDFNNTPLDEVMKTCLQDKDLSYTVDEKTILITRKIQDHVKDALVAIDVKGQVLDEFGKVVPGATIHVKGTNTRTTTDNNGEFLLKNIDEKAVLVISFIGYATQEIQVSSVMTIKLIPQLSSLNEVIVTGYSRQSKHDVTGAASTISADVIAQMPITSVEQAIQGRVAGVTVDAQGGPGDQSTIRIRGVGTLGNNDPLYVIDGVQIRVGNGYGSQNISNLLNPNDIESLTILKDPSLISLYGAEGSNGVIVITTKSGKNGDPRLEYSGYYGVTSPRNLPKIITPQQQADALYDSYKNSGIPVPGSVTSFYGTGSTPVLPDYIIETAPGNIGVMAGDPQANPALYNQQTYRILQSNKAGTDWWGALFKPAPTQNHNLSVTGGTDKSSYAVTFGYLNDQGTLLNSYFERYSLRVNTSFKIQPWLKIGENVELSYASQNSEGRGASNDIAALYQLSPLLPKYDIAGNPAGTNNALILGNTANPYTSRVNSLADKNYTQSIVGSAYVDATILKGLTYTSQIGFQFFPYEYHSYYPAQYESPVPIASNGLSEGGSYTTDWRWLNKLAYTTTINNIHNITAFVGYEVNENVFRSYGSTVTNILYPSSGTEYLGNGTVLPGPGQGTGAKATNISYFVNATYSLLDKYLFTATYRRDGTSKFGPDEEFGNFGAASAGWRISKENFLKDVSWLNDLKLRASYGTAGNNTVNTGNAYLALLSTGSFGNYDLGGTNTSSMAGYYPATIANPLLHWEVNKTTNLGFDAAFFHNSLTASFNWYNRITDQLIATPPSSGTAGAAQAPIENTMNFSNKGIELELAYHSKIGQVHYDMGFNISTDKNRINYINGLPGAFIQGGQYGSNGAIYLTRNVVGQPVSSFYGYEYEGLYRTAADVTNHATEASLGITPANALGNIMYKDLNGDGKIDASDQTFLGSPIPKFTYGYNLDLSYKNFDLGLFFQGSYGGKIFNYGRAMQDFANQNGAGLGSLTVAGLDTWSPSNPNATLPIFQQNSTVTSPTPPSSFFVESGSYLRLKMATIGYTLPKIKGIKKLRVYAQAYNLFTITKYSGQDPEVNDGNPNNLGIDYGTAYPISQKFVFGVNLGL